MATTTVRRTIEQPAERVWAVLRDYGDTAVYNPEVVRSHLLDEGDDVTVGVGRRCIFDDDGSSWVDERLVALDDHERSFTSRIERGPAKPPIDDVAVRLSVEPDGRDRSIVTATATLTGSTIAQRLLARGGAIALRRVLGRVLDGLDHHLATGEVVTDRRALAGRSRG